MQPDKNSLLLADLLPSSDHIVDLVFEKSALAAICLLFAIVAVAAAWFLWGQLKSERKDHRADCMKKDVALETLNEQFRQEMTKTITTTQGLITKLEEGNSLVSDVHDDLLSMRNAMRNGLRALGGALQVPPERMNIDND